MTAVVAATAAIIALVILTNTPRPAPISIASILTINQAANSATLGANTSASGWFLAGTAPQNYETGIDRGVTHDGKSSGYISSTVLSSEGFGTWMQMFKADEYRGKRLRMSAYVKGDNLDTGALLRMTIIGGAGTLAFDGMYDRRIKGTSDWKKYEIVLDVPASSLLISFGFGMNGKGQVWADDFQFEVVGQDVPTTKPTLKPTAKPSAKEQSEAQKRPWGASGHPTKPVNLDFEQ